MTPILFWLIGICGAVAMVAYGSPWFAGIILALSIFLSLAAMNRAGQRSQMQLLDSMAQAAQAVKEMNEAVDNAKSGQTLRGNRNVFPGQKVGKG